MTRKRKKKREKDQKIEIKRAVYEGKKEAIRTDQLIYLTEYKEEKKISK